MACGEYGPGRMSEPPQIVETIRAALSAPAGGAGLLAGRHVVVTRGRRMSRSTPFALSQSLLGQAGARHRRRRQVGWRARDAGQRPGDYPDPPGIETRHVETAREMLAAVEAALPADIFIGAAAVADWRVEATPDKIKNNGRAERRR